MKVADGLWKWFGRRTGALELESVLDLHRQVELFKKFSRQLVAAATTGALVESLVETLCEGGFDFAYVYQSHPQTGRNLRLTTWKGVDPSEGIPHEISDRFKSRFFSQRFVVSKEHKIPSALTKRILGSRQKAQGWVIGRMPASYSRADVVLIAGVQQRPLTKVQMELFDHVIIQAALGMDKIHLVESAQASRRSKSAFLANMSHEIRTPLNALIGFSEILVGETLDDQRREAVANSIKKNGESLTRLIDDVLDLSIVEAGDFKVNHKPTPLEELLEDVRAVASLKAAEKSLVFALNVDGSLPSEVVVDGLRLKQILLNVIGNAIKFTQKGSVSMSVSWRRIQGGNPQLVIYVEDTGVGIPDESQGQLFKPFSQADETATRRFGGSGLGLALAARISEEMGAQLKLVRSVRGVGTVFEVIVSCKAVDGRSSFTSSDISASVRLTKGKTEMPNLSGYRILLVEDAIDNQEIFSHFLIKAGAEVMVVDNGASAIEAALSSHFDLTLMDIQIPILDGKEATRQLRTSGYVKPIVALTAHAMREEQESCLHSGCDGQITKPVSEREFLSAVHGFLIGSGIPQNFLEARPIS